MTSITKIIPVREGAAPASKHVQQLDLNDTVFEVAQEVFGDSSRFPKPVQAIIRNYFTFKEMHLLSDERRPFHARFTALNPFPKFVNFTDAEKLKPYLHEKYQNNYYLPLAVTVAKKFYEAPVCAIGEGSPFGCVYPIYPEVLAYAMQLNKKDVVLEIAGAYGTNAVFFAFTDTKKVIVNDIDNSLLKKFEQLKGALPSDVGDKLESIRENCFNLLKVRPNLNRAVDFVLCRNLIHYFSDEKLAEFFTLLSKVLKVGGSAILIANSTYTILHKERLFEFNPDATCFTIIQCYAANYLTQSTTLICDEALVCPNDLFSMKESEFVLYNKKQGSTWTVNKTKFNQFGKKIKTIMKQACASHKKLIESISVGFVKVLIFKRRLFNEITFSQLVHRHGFEVEYTFLAKENGHLADKDLHIKQNLQIGVVFKKIYDT